MRVALNLLYLLPGVVGGTETYARALIEALAEEDGESEYLVLLNREAADWPLRVGDNFVRVPCPIRAQHRAARYAYEQTLLPLRVARARATVLHSLGYVGPIAAPVPHAVTIHDLNFRGHAGAMSPFRRHTLRAMVTATVRSADQIITVSDFSRDELVRFFGLSHSRVTVTPEAGHEDRDHGRVLPWSAIAGAYGLTRPYIVAMASASAHKNIPRLIAAFADSTLPATHDLVLIGHVASASDVTQAVQASAVADRIVVTGYVPDAHVAPLLANAVAFVFPSLYEGFGLPVLEAQAAGVPVLAAAAASLPEVAGAGALFFDPHSTDQMRDALQRVAFDARLRETLVRRGHENRARFSWRRTARLTLDVYRRLAAGRQRPDRPR